MSRKCRIAYIVSHPIQYQAPLLRYITSNSEFELKVFYLSDLSIRAYHDVGFSGSVEWDVSLLEGYDSEFLPAFGGINQLNIFRPFSYGLRSRLRDGEFDVLWSHGFVHPVNIRAMAIARSLGCKVLVRSESQLASAGGKGHLRTLKGPILKRLFKMIDGFLTIGTWNRNYFSAYGVPESRLYSVPYAVDNDFFQSRAKLASTTREAFRSELKLDGGRPIILFASKFIPRKRAEDLLEAYKKLSQNGKSEPLPYLIFVGDGELRKELQITADATGWSSIRFLGFKNQTELPRLYDLCDVFVLPSESEPWGLIVNEVMNASKPIIVSDQVGAGPDLVRDGVNGYVVPSRQPAALAARLRSILEEPVLARDMGMRSLDRINEWSFIQDLYGLTQACLSTMSQDINRIQR